MYAALDERRLYSFTQHMQNWFLNLPVILLKWSDLSLPFLGILISPWIFSYPKCLPTYPLEAAALTNHVQQQNKIPEIFVALATTMFYNSYATDASLFKGHFLLDSVHVLLKSMWVLPLTEWALDQVLTAKIVLQW